MNIFLATVWLILNSITLFTMLIAWEIIGLISFNLISTWIFRSWTLSSSFSAIGFNRIGDIGFLIIILLFNKYYFINYSNIIIILLFFICNFKSISIMSYLWLPEAMEGPTPVSSLLHSATLVMAGLFTWTNFGICSSIYSIIFFIISFSLITLISKPEIDLKRIIAASTIVVVSFLWLIMILSLSNTAVIICIIHASYKSALFLSVGKILTKLSIYNDNLGIPNSNKTLIILISIFLFGFKTSNYSISKHSIDILILINNINFLLILILSINIIILWLLVIKLNNQNKLLLNNSNIDLQLFSMIISIFILESFIIVTIINGNSNIISFLFILIFKLYIKIQFNIGSINLSTNIINILVVRIPFLIKYLLVFYSLNTIKTIPLLCFITIIMVYLSI